MPVVGHRACQRQALPTVDVVEAVSCPHLVVGAGDGVVPGEGDLRKYLEREIVEILVCSSCWSTARNFNERLLHDVR